MVILKKAQKKFLVRVGLIIGIFLFAIAKFFGLAAFSDPKKSNSFINIPTVRADVPTYYDNSGSQHGGDGGPGADGISSSSCPGSETGGACPS